MTRRAEASACCRLNFLPPIPLIIMTTVVLSLIGALMGLLICDLPFSIIMTGIGVISLAGVVVNNAIVLLAYTRQLQAEGMDLISAAEEAGITRLRPVMLTAMTTITGLIPMADPKQGEDLLSRIQIIRQQTAQRMGFIVPMIRIVDNMRLKPNEYCVISDFANGIIMRSMPWMKCEPSCCSLNLGT